MARAKTQARTVMLVPGCYAQKPDVYAALGGPIIENHH
jgi:hypothetical protein